MSNPLLTQAPLPLFEQIQVKHILPAIQALISEYEELILNITAQENPDFATLVQPLEVMENKMELAFAPIAHLNSVKNTPELRKVYEKAVELLSQHNAKVGQNVALYEAFQALFQDPIYQTYNPAQQKIIQNALRDFKCSGVALNPSDKQKFIAYTKTLSRLETTFSENVLDATEGWVYHTEDKSLLSGIPEHAIEEAQKKARLKGKQGFLFTLEYPSYSAVVRYAENRSLREAFYTAYITRASDVGPNASQWDNHTIMQAIIDTRQKLASLLDFNNYAEYSLVPKMASDTSEVLAFLEKLADQIKPMAEKEYQLLSDFAQPFQADPLKPWDIAYFSEKKQEKDYQVSQEAFRPYFCEEKVLSGLFEIVSRLYGMRVEVISSFETYHQEVKLFEIYDKRNQLRGRFYLDLYAREHKRGGAWMGECVTRFKQENGQIQIPVVFVTCNFSAPLRGSSCLMTHDEVITLFHEFGHCLHHILTTVDYFSVAGGNGVEWDAIELPSQFLENWAWEWEAVSQFARHYKTGLPLEKSEFEKLRLAKNFHSGMHLARQLEFALFDFQLHLNLHAEQNQTIHGLLESVREKIAVVPTSPFNRFENSFTHIFSGGYAGGYYSYLWAEVLSADAFEKFQEEGIFNPKTGEAFLTHILEAGGVGDALSRYVNFRGRKPNQEAFLKQHGIL